MDGGGGGDGGGVTTETEAGMAGLGVWDLRQGRDLQR